MYACSHIGGWMLANHTINEYGYVAEAFMNAYIAACEHTDCSSYTTIAPCTCSSISNLLLSHAYMHGKCVCIYS